jgi:hypothetical protein
MIRRRAGRQQQVPTEGALEAPKQRLRHPAEAPQDVVLVTRVIGYLLRKYVIGLDRDSLESETR